MGILQAHMGLHHLLTNSVILQEMIELLFRVAKMMRQYFVPSTEVEYQSIRKNPILESLHPPSI